MTHDLALADLSPLVETAYDVFAKYTLRFPLQCCACEWCLPPEMQLKIIRNPVQTLDLGLLQTWEGSAASQARIARESGVPPTEAWSNEVRALLPRMMAVIVSGQTPSGLGIENAFRTVALADWPHWPVAERDILLRFAEAFFLAHHRIMAFSIARSGHFLASGVKGRDVAVSLLILGLEAERIIDLWRQIPDPVGAVHLADARHRLYFDWEARTHKIKSVWLEDHPACFSLGEWLAGPEVQARLEAAFFAVEGDGHAARAMREILSRSLE